MAGDRERLLAAGFDEYVAKPIVDETILLDAIARCLGGAR
jgi:CheY-like chemotaxis protein